MTKKEKWEVIEMKITASRQISKMPYIHIRQVITYIILLISVVLSTESIIQNNLFACLISYYIVVSGVTFIPSIKREIAYSDIVHMILYYLPMYIWGVDMFNVHCSSINVNPYFYILMLVLVLGVIFIRRKEIGQIVDGIPSKIPITNAEFCRNIIQECLAILSEEIYFSAFIISRTREYDLLVAMVISTILFHR